MIRDGRKASDRSASLDRMALLHHEVLRVVIEGDRNSCGPWTNAFGHEGVSNRMTLHVRFSDVRQRHGDLVAELLRRFFQKLDRMGVAERDALHQVVVFRIQGENWGLPVHG